MNHNDHPAPTFNPTSSSYWSPTLMNNEEASSHSTANLANPENDFKRRRTHQQSQPSEFPYSIPESTQLEKQIFPAWSPRTKAHNERNNDNLISYSSSNGSGNYILPSSTNSASHWEPHQLIRSQSMTGLHSLTTTPVSNDSRQVQSRDQSPMRSMVDLTLDETSLPPNHQHQNGHNTFNNAFHPSQPPSLFMPPYSTNSASVFKAQQRNNHPPLTTFDHCQQTQPATPVFTPHHPFITRPHSTSGAFFTTKPSSAASASSSSPLNSTAYSSYINLPSLQEPTDLVTQTPAVKPLKEEQQTAAGPFDNDNFAPTVKNESDTKVQAATGPFDNGNIAFTIKSESDTKGQAATGPFDNGNIAPTVNSESDTKVQTAEMVDDDNDDDDDVIIDEEMTNRNICLGMLKSDVVTKDPLFLIKDDLFEPVVMQMEGLRQNNYSFTISSRSDPKKFYGWVPFEDTSILGPIAERHLVWWDTVIPRSKANMTRTPLYIILYCRSNDYKILHRYLFFRRLDLQDPPFFNPACRYNNPRFSRKNDAPPLYQQEYDPNPTYVDQTKRRITQLLDSIPNSTMRRRAFYAKTTTNDTTGTDIDGDSLKQYGLTVEDLRMEGLTITLLPHQVEGIRWMIDMENNKHSSGGILADMGLGKTIQTIGLVSKARESATDKRQKTLIIAPLALIQQWASEFGNKTTADNIKVLVHHGGDRTTDHRDFDDYDVVVTTYQIVASDLAQNGTKKKRGRKRLQKQRQQPLQTLGKDGSDLMDGDLSGDDDTSAVSSRAASPDGQEEEHSQPTGDDGPLFQVDWHRVVLDEAQQIKNHMTRSAIACSKLAARKRWCLTGTPIQNRVEELYSLIRFLRIPPFSDLATFKQSISIPIQEGNIELALGRLKTLLLAIMLRRTKQILSTQPVTPATDPSQTRPNSSSSSTTTATTSGQSTPAESSSLSSTLALSLPPRQKEDVVLEFNEEERKLYDVLTKKSSAAVQKMVKSGKSTGSYMNMLCLVLRLRQACNHPQLVLQALGNDEDLLALTSETSATKRETNEATMQRVLMTQMATDLGWSGVGRVGQSVFDKSLSTLACELCARPVMKMDSEETTDSKLPYCTNCTNQIKQYTSMMSPVATAPFSTSTKINKMLDILQHTRQQHPDDKTIIFSQFTSMLDLMEEPLQSLGFKYCRYDGSMPNNAREKSLRVLRSDPECRVMLISLKSGSLGLNLTAANRVILMDVWWNPAVEDQAIDRVHRIGQKLPVHVTRLLIDGTVEQKIIKIQERKAKIASGALSDHMTSSSNLTTQELLSLFDY